MICELTKLLCDCGQNIDAFLYQLSKISGDDPESFSKKASSDYKMDGWLTCYFTFFLTVFQSYQDDEWMIMKGCEQLNLVYGSDYKNKYNAF